MRHQRRIPAVQKTLRQPRQQIQAPVGLPQQQRAAIAGHGSAVERGAHLARRMLQIRSSIGYTLS